MKPSALLTRDFWDIRLTRLLRGWFVKGFIKTYYYRGDETWQHMFWLGRQTLKAPTDLWVYQEILFEQRPDFIIETGTFKGGSALYLASICDLIGHGTVITIDIQDSGVSHPRIVPVVDPQGSTAPHVVERVRSLVADKRCFVVLDSTHRPRHVLDEIHAYARLVPVGGYLVVEDTCLGGHPVLPSWGPGPYDAVQDFIKEGTFVVDRSREKFLLTLHPSGFLRRVREDGR